MKKVQKNLSVAQDVLLQFEQARDRLGHGYGWAMVTSAMRMWLKLTPAQQREAIRGEFDRDVDEKLQHKIQENRAEFGPDESKPDEDTKPRRKKG